MKYESLFKTPQVILKSEYIDNTATFEFEIAKEPEPVSLWSDTNTIKAYWTDIIDREGQKQKHLSPLRVGDKVRLHFMDTDSSFTIDSFFEQDETVFYRLREIEGGLYLRSSLELVELKPVKIKLKDLI